MTNENLAELRLRLTTLVTLAGVPGAEIIDADPRDFKFRDHPSGYASCAVVFPLGPCGNVEPPPLTTAQQLALSVLIGEPDTVTMSALADMLLDMGHEYATAVAEKARAEERQRCAVLVESRADTWGVGDYELNEIAAAIRRT